MAWTYKQSTGELSDPSGKVVGIGYSGNGEGLNNPLAEAQVGSGPIPTGEWIIGAFFNNPGDKGPIVCRLSPLTSTFALGRSGFMIHGDNEEENHTASEGCIILERPLREMIKSSEDKRLIVIS